MRDRERLRLRARYCHLLENPFRALATVDVAERDVEGRKIGPVFDERDRLQFCGEHKQKKGKK